MNTSINPKELKRPDAFTQTTRSFFDTVLEKRGVVGALAGVILVAGIAGSIWSDKKKSSLNLAKKDLREAKIALEQELIAQAPKTLEESQGKPAVPGGAILSDEQRLDMVRFKKLDVQAVLSVGIGKLKEVAEKHRGTPVARDALWMLGDAYFHHGVPAEAIVWYRQLLKDSQDGFDKVSTAYSLGMAQENAGQFADAIATFEIALAAGKNESSEGGLKGSILMAMARCHEKLGANPKAIEVYDRVIKELPNSTQSKAAEIQKRLIQDAQKS